MSPTAPGAATYTVARLREVRHVEVHARLAVPGRVGRRAGRVLDVLQRVPVDPALGVGGARAGGQTGALLAICSCNVVVVITQVNSALTGVWPGPGMLPGVFFIMYRGSESGPGPGEGMMGVPGPPGGPGPT